MYLDHFRNKIVLKGLEYHFEDRVKGLESLDASTYSASVEGNGEEDYHVRIDLNEPYRSYCSCPYAADGNLCKHMAAVYFEAFPDEAKEYEYELYGDMDDTGWEEDPDWEYEDGEEDDHYGSVSSFVVPLHFEKMLDEFIEKMDEKEAKDLLKQILNEDKEETFRRYLKNEYERLMKNKTIAMQEQINRNIERTIENSFRYAYPYMFNEPFFSDEEKDYLKDDIECDIKFRKDLIFDVRLYAYKENLFLVALAKKWLSASQQEGLKKALIEYFNVLKQMGLKSPPKSNVLIAVYELDPVFDPEILAGDLVDHMRYEEYVKHVIDVYENKEALFKGLAKVCETSHKNHAEYSETFRYLGKAGNIEEAMKLSHFYGLVYGSNLVDLDELMTYEDFEQKYYPKLIACKKDFVIKNVYAGLGQKKELYAYLKGRNDIGGLMFYASILDEIYHDELLSIFKEKMYEKLSQSKNRQDYKEACRFITAIKNLHGGDDLIDELICELKQDERFRRRTALFDEIAISRKR